MLMMFMLMLMMLTYTDDALHIVCLVEKLHWLLNFPAGEFTPFLANRHPRVTFLLDDPAALQTINRSIVFRANNMAQISSPALVISSFWGTREWVVVFVAHSLL